MNNPLLSLALSQSCEILQGNLTFESREAKLSAIHFIHTQVKTLWIEPGDPIPFGLTARQRFEALIFMRAAIASLQEGGCSHE